jgi:hypothetical protein
VGPRIGLDAVAKRKISASSKDRAPVAQALTELSLLDEVSGQLHAPVVLPPGRLLPVPTG